MVCCGGGNDEDTDRSKEIERKLREDAKADENKVKLLLLGAGESGKSTIFKQMKILYGVPPSEEERASYTQVIHNNTIETMQKVIEQMYEWGLNEQCQCMDSSKVLERIEGTTRVDATIGAAIKTLWADPAIQAVWARRNEFQVIETIKYFFDHIDRISATDYLPTQQDHLHTRVRTSGVVETTYKIQNVNFEMYDVGGQRNERRKWIHCFSEVTAVMFVAALSEYDQMLFEENSTNRMQEALVLFEEICKNEYFTESAIILFLNKTDLFEEKLPNNPIAQTKMWEDYTGGDDVKAGQEYFLQHFLERKGDPRRMVYPHFTNATSTTNIQHVFNACKDIILDRNINESGF